jgi:TonB family protein
MNQKIGRILILTVIFLFPTTLIFGQTQTYTIRVIDSNLKNGINEVVIKKRDSTLTKSNHLGFFQIVSIPNDTILLSHTDYGEKILMIPAESRFTIELEKVNAKRDSIYFPENVDKVAVPLIGMDAFHKMWIDNVLKNGGYPKEARQRGVEGRVFVYFIIDENGEVAESGIDKGIGFGCDERALEGFRKTKTQWTPAIKNGQKVKTRISIPFTFRLG